VSSTAASRYTPTIPNATGIGCHFEANGTSTDARPKCTYVSPTIAAT
jgi:hypothetical protein